MVVLYSLYTVPLWEILVREFVRSSLQYAMLGGEGPTRNRNTGTEYVQADSSALCPILRFYSSKS